jgi:hypothetical protein
MIKPTMKTLLQSRTRMTRPNQDRVHGERHEDLKTG